MKRSMKYSGAVLILMAILTAAGCSKSDQFIVSNDVTAQALSYSEFTGALQSVSPSGTLFPYDIDPSASLLAATSVQGIGSVSALFLANGIPADAGTISVRTSARSSATDTVVMAIHTSEKNGTHFITYSASFRTLSFNGSAYHVFRVAGSSDVAPVYDSIRSVEQLFITQPQPNQTFPKRSGMQIRWTTGNDSTAAIFFVITSVEDTTIQLSVRAVNESGGIADISAEQLDRFPPGAVAVSAGRYRLQYITQNGKRIGMLSHSIARVQALLQ